MTEFKGTPGPWQNDPHIGATFGPNGLPIMTAGGGCPGPEGDEGRANARLISAAPELLAACQLMLPLLEHAEKCERSADDGFGSRLRKLRRNLDQVRAAIAKALGK